jgi:hypothetical protein
MASLDAEWQGFLDSPADYVAPERLSECLGGQISPTGCQLLLRSRRLQTRLSQRLVKHYRLTSTAKGGITEEDRAIALLAAEKFSELALRSGAVFWATSIAGAIGKKEAAVLHSRLGENVITCALRHRGLSAPGRPVGDAEAALEEIEADGWRCIHGWLADAPALIAARLRLKFADDLPGKKSVTPEHEELGAKIVRRVIGDIDA